MILPLPIYYQYFSLRRFQRLFFICSIFLSRQYLQSNPSFPLLKFKLKTNMQSLARSVKEWPWSTLKYASRWFHHHQQPRYKKFIGAFLALSHKTEVECHDFRWDDICGKPCCDNIVHFMETVTSLSVDLKREVKHRGGYWWVLRKDNRWPGHLQGTKRKANSVTSLSTRGLLHQLGSYSLHQSQH